MCPPYVGVSRFFGGRRLRPLLSKKHKDLRFAFDCVFDETSSQAEVFRQTTHDVIDGVLDGINCSIFAYGATGEWVWGVVMGVVIVRTLVVSWMVSIVPMVLQVSGRGEGCLQQSRDPA